jgi:hypothetical protein
MKFTSPLARGQCSGILMSSVTGHAQGMGAFQ